MTTWPPMISERDDQLRVNSAAEVALVPAPGGRRPTGLATGYERLARRRRSRSAVDSARTRVM